MRSWKRRILTNTTFGLLAGVGALVAPVAAPVLAGALTVNAGLAASTLAKQRRRLAVGG